MLNNKGSKIAEAGRVTDAKGKISYEAQVNGKDIIFDENGTFTKAEHQFYRRSCLKTNEAAFFIQSRGKGGVFLFCNPEGVAEATAGLSKAYLEKLSDLQAGECHSYNGDMR
jgi:hypothetical protein